MLDIHLPDMSGIDVLQAIRNLPGDPVDVIAITAARELDTVRAAMAGGVMHYLVKPFVSRVLLDRLDQYVTHRQAMLEHDSSTTPALDQEHIDRMLQPRSSPTQAPTQTPTHGALAKGLSASTLAAVVGALKLGHDGVSATEVAEQVGVARVSARRYLEYLVARRQATITQKYGSAGRPEKLYRWQP